MQTQKHYKLYLNNIEEFMNSDGNLITRFFRSEFDTRSPKATCHPCIIPDNFHQKYFHQNLDHFDKTVITQWEQVLVYQQLRNSLTRDFHFIFFSQTSQRYFFNKNHLKDDGPVFLIVGGLHEIFSIDLQSSAWIELAKETGALLLCLEHRYYGKSQPTE